MTHSLLPIPLLSLWLSGVFGKVFATAEFCKFAPIIRNAVEQLKMYVGRQGFDLTP